MRTARDGPRSWTSHTLKVVCEMDTSAGQENGRSEVNNRISIWNVTSHADETEIMGGDCSVSNTADDDGWSLCDWHCGRVEPLWAI